MFYERNRETAVDDLARKYATKGRRAVRGWLSGEFAETLLKIGSVQQSLGIRGAVAEIGVYQGQLFILLALLCRPGECALAIDVFDPAYGADVRTAFLSNLKRFGIEPEIISEDSRRLTADRIRAAAGPVRLFSVDGDHSAVATASDITLAAESLVEGGILVVDDVFNIEHPGVAEGLFRTLPTRSDLYPVAIVDNRFIFAKGHAEDYRKALRGKCLEVLGSPVVIVPVGWRMRARESALWHRMRQGLPGACARRVLRLIGAR